MVGRTGKSIVWLSQRISRAPVDFAIGVTGLLASPHYACGLEIVHVSSRFTVKWRMNCSTVGTY